VDKDHVLPQRDQLRSEALRAAKRLRRFQMPVNAEIDLADRGSALQSRDIAAAPAAAADGFEQARLYVRSLAITDRVYEQFARSARFKHLAEHVIDLAAGRLSRRFQLFKWPLVDLPFTRLSIHVWCSFAGRLVPPAAVFVIRSL
jgi:hypothetical protein